MLETLLSRLKKRTPDVGPTGLQKNEVVAASPRANFDILKKMLAGLSQSASFDENPETRNFITETNNDLRNIQKSLKKITALIANLRSLLAAISLDNHYEDNKFPYRKELDEFLAKISNIENSVANLSTGGENLSAVNLETLKGELTTFIEREMIWKMREFYKRGGGKTKYDVIGEIGEIQERLDRVFYLLTSLKNKISAMGARSNQETQSLEINRSIEEIEEKLRELSGSHS